MLDLTALHATTLALATMWALWLRPRPMALVPMVVVFLHIAILQFWVLINGLTVGLSLWSWRAVLAGVLIGAVLAASLARAKVIAEWAVWRRRTWRTYALAGARKMWVLLGIVCLVPFYLALGARAAGPVLGDVSGYYLVPPTDWIAKGAIVAKPWPDPRCWWPQGQGLLAVVYGLTLGQINAMTMAGVHWAVLAFTVVWAMSRQIGADVREAALATILLTTAPIVWAQASCGLNDLGMGVVALAGGVAVIGRSVNRSRLGLALAAVLVGIGIKPTVFLLGAPVLAIGLWRWLKGHNVPQPGASIWPTALMLLVALSLGTFWYARNVLWMTDHNPLYPAGLELAGWRIWDGHPDYAHHGHISLEQLRQNLFCLFGSRGWDKYGLDSGQTSASTGWGPVVMGLGWASLLVLSIGAPRTRWGAGLLVSMMLVLGSGIEADGFFGRMYAFVAVALVVYVAMVTCRLRAGPVRRGWIAMLLVAGLWGFARGACRAPTEDAVEQWLMSGNIFRSPAPYATPQSRFLDEHVPSDATIVLVGARSADSAALLHGPEVRRRLIYASQAPDWFAVESWRRDGARWVWMINSDIPGPADPAALGLRHVRERLYEMP